MPDVGTGTTLRVRCVWCGYQVSHGRHKVCTYCLDLENALRDCREGTLTPGLRVV